MITPGQASAPVSNVIWVPLEKVRANDYNPNIVAKTELDLLYTSIKADGYTQPIVCVRDDEAGDYVIVDGFHRHLIMKRYKDIFELYSGHLPIVVIAKSMNDRMASTVRHNRARGKHNVGGMANLVFSMLDNGWADEEVCNEMGLSIDELLRLKYVTGFARLFENVEYSKAWETRRQIKIRHDYRRGSMKGAKPHSG